MILTEAEWFTADPLEVSKAYKEIFKNYSKWLTKAKRQGHKSRTEFNFDKMKSKLETILDENVVKAPTQVGLQLPKLKKVGTNTEQPKLKLPKLKKL